MLTATLKDIGRPIAYLPNLARVFGVTETILLCQLLYWLDAADREGEEDDEWTGEVWKSPAEFTRELGFSYKAQLTARRNLKALGILSERVEPLEHTTYFRLNKKRLNDLWESRNAQKVIPECPKGNPGTPIRAFHIYTENTSESTSETKSPFVLNESPSKQEREVQPTLGLPEEQDQKKREPVPTALVDLPEPIRTPAVHTEWLEWVADLKDRRKPLTARAAKMQLKKLASWGPAKAIQAMRTAMEMRWQSVFEPRDENGTGDNLLDFIKNPN